MARQSDDPYSDFVVRVMNAARIARNQTNKMSEGEFAIVESVRRTLVDLDPHAEGTPKANVILRPYPKG